MTLFNEFNVVRSDDFNIKSVKKCVFGRLACFGKRHF